MRTSIVAVFGTAVVVLVSALAETRTASRLHPDSLARVEAITSYCQQADPTDTAEYAARLAETVRGHSSGEIQRSRETPKYQHAMIQAHDTLSRVSPGRAVQACTEFLAEK